MTARAQPRQLPAKPKVTPEAGCYHGVTWQYHCLFFRQATAPSRQTRKLATAYPQTIPRRVWIAPASANRGKRQACNACSALAAQVCRLSSKSFWLKEQLSSVNSAPASKRSSRLCSTCPYCGGSAANKSALARAQLEKSCTARCWSRTCSSCWRHWARVFKCSVILRIS